MTIYYADFDLATGDNDGTSQADAWQTLQRAIDGTDGTQPVATDIVLCKGTDTLTVSVDVDGNSGSGSTGFIKFVGVNDSWVVDGTKAVIDADSTAAQCLLFNNVDYNWFENFELKNATGDNIFRTTSSSLYIVLLNCDIHDAGASGIDLNGTERFHIIFCKIYDNGSHGIDAPGGSSRIIFSSIYGNALKGVDSISTSLGVLYYGCVIYDNGNSQINLEVNYLSLVINCVIDGTNQTTPIGVSIDLTGSDEIATFIGNRITNHATGIDGNSVISMFGWNYIEGNTADIADGTLLYNLPEKGVPLTNETLSGGIDGTNKTGGTIGYEDASTGNFNLTNSATLRREAIEL